VKNPLFLCGPANCGTNLVKAILGVNKNIHLESEPFLPLFQFLRTEILKQNINDKKTKNTDPLFEYYFSQLDLKKLLIIQNSSLKVKIKKKQLNSLKKNILKRMDDYVPHLKKNINNLKGKNFKKIFDNALKIIDKNHKKKNPKWIGWMDSWIEEFFPILAKEYPKAKFILILRDPRAAVASYTSYFKKNNMIQLAPLTLSYLRCWRKQVAFAEYFNLLNLLNNRIIIVKYEDVVENPKKITKKLCKFLNIKYSNSMINTNNFMGLGKNTKKWIPNSNFNTNQKGIYKTSLNKWKKFLKKDLKNFIEFVVGIELKHLGYKRNIIKTKKSKILRYHSIDYKSSKGWRTSKNSPLKDIEFEFSRHKILKLDKIKNLEITKNFLFKDAFLAFKNKVVR
tara:strand:- start:31057 stop:32241 length:1185 start_codon:yes stop_codon:yes gene_type:complete